MNDFINIPYYAQYEKKNEKHVLHTNIIQYLKLNTNPFHKNTKSLYIRIKRKKNKNEDRNVQADQEDTQSNIQRIIRKWKIIFEIKWYQIVWRYAWLKFEKWQKTIKLCRLRDTKNNLKMYKMIKNLKI